MLHLTLVTLRLIGWFLCCQLQITAERTSWSLQNAPHFSQVITFENFQFSDFLQTTRFKYTVVTRESSLLEKGNLTRFWQFFKFSFSVIFLKKNIFGVNCSVPLISMDRNIRNRYIFADLSVYIEGYKNHKSRHFSQAKIVISTHQILRPNRFCRFHLVLNTNQQLNKTSQIYLQIQFWIYVACIPCKFYIVQINQ